MLTSSSVMNRALQHTARASHGRDACSRCRSLTAIGVRLSPAMDTTTVGRAAPAVRLVASATRPPPLAPVGREGQPEGRPRGASVGHCGDPVRRRHRARRARPAPGRPTWAPTGGQAVVDPRRPGRARRVAPRGRRPRGPWRRPDSTWSSRALAWAAVLPALRPEDAYRVTDFFASAVDAAAPARAGDDAADVRWVSRASSSRWPRRPACSPPSSPGEPGGPNWLWTPPPAPPALPARRAARPRRPRPAPRCRLRGLPRKQPFRGGHLRTMPVGLRGRPRKRQAGGGRPGRTRKRVRNSGASPASRARYGRTNADPGPRPSMPGQ